MRNTIQKFGLPWWLSWWRIHLPCMRPRFDPWVGKIPWRRARQPTPVSFPGESHGQRSLASCSPWGHKGSETTERLSTYTYLCHEVPQTGWLKTVKIHCFMFWRLEAQNQGVWRASLPRKETFWLVPRSGDVSVLWLVDDCLHIIVPLCMPLFVQMSPFHKDTSHTGL